MVSSPPPPSIIRVVLEPISLSAKALPTSPAIRPDTCVSPKPTAIPVPPMDERPDRSAVTPVPARAKLRVSEAEPEAPTTVAIPPPAWMRFVPTDASMESLPAPATRVLCPSPAVSVVAPPPAMRMLPASLPMSWSVPKAEPMTRWMLEICAWPWDPLATPRRRSTVTPPPAEAGAVSASKVRVLRP